MNINSDKECCQIYLVLSQTGSILSKALKVITKAKYNHSSISLTGDLKNMYSFGRLKLYNAFQGGYVKESIGEGMFKRFSDTDAAVFVITVPKDKYCQIHERLEEMYENREQYHYNVLGLFTAFFGCHYQRKNKYYCSDFVSEVLTDFDIIPEGALDKIVKPIDFYSLFEDNLIYEGKFKDYSCTEYEDRVLTLNRA